MKQLFHGRYDEAGGLPVLAHPLFIKDPEAMIKKLAGNGLTGIEAYYGKFNAEEISGLISLAERYGLLCTGGSDYHGLDDTAEAELGSIDVPLEAAERLIALSNRSPGTTGVSPVGL